jgi:hypothetical protein
MCPSLPLFAHLLGSTRWLRIFLTHTLRKQRDTGAYVLQASLKTMSLKIDEDQSNRFVPALLYTYVPTFGNWYAGDGMFLTGRNQNQLLHDTCLKRTIFKNYFVLYVHFLVYGVVHENLLIFLEFQAIILHFFFEVYEKK